MPFSWYEPMWLENLGFCAEGDGWKLTEAGATAPDGDIPWNPSGGVLSSNPIGARGMIRFGEAAQQVRERGRRLPGAALDRQGARPRVRRRLAVLLDVGGGAGQARVTASRVGGRSGDASDSLGQPSSPGGSAGTRSVEDIPAPPSAGAAHVGSSLMGDFFSPRLGISGVSPYWAV